ncbi:MAG: DivIVA domain-containing protein [Gordonia sp. (in: high G+C Gram-positive bacteria)]
MATLLLYLLIMALVVAVVFVVVWFVFGRGEDLPPLDEATTLTRLPRSGITGYDVRDLKFVLTARGYKQSEVDWALARLADEIDDLRALVRRLQDRDGVTAGVGAPGHHGRHEDGAEAPHGVAGEPGAHARPGVEEVRPDPGTPRPESDT